MTEVARRWQEVADAFGARVAGVAEGAWENASPCEGWTARDVVRHLTEWVPPFLVAGADVEIPSGPSPDDDPAAAWAHLDAAIRQVLADPEVHERTFDHPRAGTHRLDDAIEAFVLGDVLVHTWDLARATGQDERLHPPTVAWMASALEPIADVLVESGHYGARVAVPDGADAQTRMLALTGRRA